MGIKGVFIISTVKDKRGKRKGIEEAEKGRNRAKEGRRGQKGRKDFRLSVCDTENHYNTRAEPLGSHGLILNLSPSPWHLPAWTIWTSYIIYLTSNAHRYKTDQPKPPSLGSTMKIKENSLCKAPRMIHGRCPIMVTAFDIPISIISSSYEKKKIFGASNIQRKQIMAKLPRQTPGKSHTIPPWDTRAPPPVWSPLMVSKKDTQATLPSLRKCLLTDSQTNVFSHQTVTLTDQLPWLHP